MRLRLQTGSCPARHTCYPSRLLHFSLDQLKSGKEASYHYRAHVSSQILPELMRHYPSSTLVFHISLGASLGVSTRLTSIKARNSITPISHGFSKVLHALLQFSFSFCNSLPFLTGSLIPLMIFWIPFGEFFENY
jgi:hypothetical protein